MANEILKMENITKIYPNGIAANKNVNFSVAEGEIHSLMGENGAGKSTLMKILFGLETHEEGDVYINGEKVNIDSPTSAINHGIGMVHQHFMLVPSLTVAENMVLGIEPKKGLFFDKAKAVKMTEEISKKYNLQVDAKAKVSSLSVGMKQKVEILKALLRGAKILILDEPTAVLTPQETRELFEKLINLKKNGHTIIFISHKIKEIKEICDRITIMRNGRSMGVYNVKDVSEEDISKLMVGRDVVLKISKEKAKPCGTILKVRNLNYFNESGKCVLKNINFSIRSGEILGVAGVEGNGQKELVELITGMKKFAGGDISINNKLIKNLSVREIRKLKTAYIPEDRMTDGVAEAASIEENLISSRFSDRDLNRGLLFNMPKIHNLSDKLSKDYKIKCDSPVQQVKMLSGGNIQKVVVAREFSSEPELLVADQPTRGIDVGAAEFIHNKIVEMRDNKTAVFLISADLNEVLELSDSLIVMCGGEIVAYFEDSSSVSEEELGLYMLGLKRQPDEDIRRIMYE